jgi:hypothetical protein
MANGNSHDFDESDLGSLSTAYAVAIRLERAGESHDEIALALGTTPGAVAGLLTLAHRKIDEFRRTVPAAAPDEASPDAVPPSD